MQSHEQNKHSPQRILLPPPPSLSAADKMPSDPFAATDAIDHTIVQKDRVEAFGCAWIPLPKNRVQFMAAQHVLFAGWMSTLLQRTDGTLHLNGLPSPAERCLLKDICQQQLSRSPAARKYFGFETWIGYQSIDGTIRVVPRNLDHSALHADAAHQYACTTLTPTSIVTTRSAISPPCVAVLLKHAKDVACAGVAGLHTIVAIDNSGQLFSWPSFHTPSTIQDTSEASTTLPLPVRPLKRDNVVEGADEGVLFEKVWAGEAHFLALSSDGRLFSWGSGRFGQLGHGTVQEDVVHPTPIEALEGLRIVDAACGATHSLALSEIGDVYAFGLNNYGQLGIGIGGCTALPPMPHQHSNDKRDPVNTALPQLVDFYDLDRSPTDAVDVNIVKIACGNAHSAVLDDQGHLYTCGWNKYGQLGGRKKDAKGISGELVSSSSTSSSSQSSSASPPSSSSCPPTSSSSFFFQRVPSDRPWENLCCGRWTTFVW